MFQKKPPCTWDLISEQVEQVEQALRNSIDEHIDRQEIHVQYSFKDNDCEKSIGSVLEELLSRGDVLH